MAWDSTKTGGVGNDKVLAADWNAMVTDQKTRAVGPASATDGDIVQFDSTTGKLLKALHVHDLNNAGYPMTVVTGTTQAAAVENRYVTNNGAAVTVTLPATALVGQRVAVIGLGAGGWIIAQNASQLIHIGAGVTTTGTGGSLTSTNQWDSIELVCIVANTTWTATSVVGNITVA